MQVESDSLRGLRVVRGTYVRDVLGRYERLPNPLGLLLAHLHDMLQDRRSVVYWNQHNQCDGGREQADAGPDGRWPSKRDRNGRAAKGEPS